jgi:predicted acetyltransferase
MPTARSVRPEEIERAGEVGAVAFEGELEEWQRAFREHAERYGNDALIVVEHEGKIVSSMLIVPEGMRLGEVTVPSVAVAGVGTVPEARCAGCAATMLREATRRMRDMGAATSAMWPFSFAYYRKFGWEIGGETRVVTWNRDMQWQIAPAGHVSDGGLDDVPDVASVWEAEAGNHRCATATEGRYFEDVFRRAEGKTDRGALICRENGRATGYAFYVVPEQKEGEEPKPVEIMEIRAEGAAASLALIGALTERVEGAAYRAHLPADDRLRSVAVNPRALETRNEASFGFRVIDPRPILATMRTEQALAPVTLHVGDSLLGDSAWRVTFDGGPATMTETRGEADVSCSVQTFSQMASGFLKPAAAWRAGLLAGDARAVARLDSATAHWTLPCRSRMERG